MRISKLSIISLILVAFFLSIIPQAMAGKSKHKLKIAQTVFPKGSAHMDSIERIAKEITAQTDGRITFKIYGPELADWSELNEMVNRGFIDMMLSPMSPSFDPRWNATYTPYIVTTYDKAKEAFGAGGFMDEMFHSWANDVNMVWLGTWLQGFTGVSLSQQAALDPEQAKGIKIRTPPIAAFECYWNALGFTPSLIPYSEVPTAISTGVVDGQAGGGPFQTYNCCRDLNKYFVFYRDSVELWGYTINKKTWNKLDKADQKIIQTIVTNEAAVRVDGAEKEDMDYMQKLRDHGLEVVDLADHPKLLNAARDAGRTCWTKLDGIVGKVWMDKIRTAVGVEIK